MGRVLGVTGTFGSGKSAVAEMFRRGVAGAETIDADRLAAEAVAPGTQALAEIVRIFGTEVRADDGSLRREVLGRRVFADREALARLEGVIHPIVLRRIAERLGELADRPLIVLDVPLLFECNMQAMVEQTAVVTVSERKRFARLRRRGFDESEIVRRLGLQMPQSRKIRLADFLIHNHGDLEQTHRQVDHGLKYFLERKPRYHEPENDKRD